MDGKKLEKGLLQTVLFVVGEHTVGKIQVMGHCKSMRLHGMMLAVVKTTDIIIHEVGNPSLGHVGCDERREMLGRGGCDEGRVK